MYSQNSTSRFRTTGRDPLWKLKELQQKQFLKEYELINEQQFAQPIKNQEDTLILSSKEQSLRSLLNSIVVKEEEPIVQIQKDLELTNRKNKIFQSIDQNMPTIKPQLQNQIQIQNRQRNIINKSICVQTSFERFDSNIFQKSGIQKTERSVQVTNINDDSKLNMLDANYDYLKWQIHNNWKPNISEQRFHLDEETVNYYFCHKCLNYAKKQFYDQHKMMCQQNNLIKRNEYEEMIIKLHYLMKQETNRLRDFNDECQKYRFFAYGSLEILQNMIDAKLEKRKQKLLYDFKLVTERMLEYKQDIFSPLNQLIQNIIPYL
ncbi:hypothetical protein pb186bvf_018583 [Paramecium bursaria]